MDGGLSTIRDLESDVSGTLKWDNDALITNTFLNTTLLNYVTSSFLTSTLSNYMVSNSITNLVHTKQDALTAGTGIAISNNTISSTVTGATQSWVTANFLSPLNPLSVGVTAGLSATMTANTFIISVDQNFDRRKLFILEDANSVLRNITTNTAGQLLYDNAALATVSAVALKQDTLVNYTETTGSTTTIVQTMDDIPAPSINLEWTSGSYTNVPGSHQVIDYVSVYHTFTGMGSGTCYMTIQLKAGTTNEAVFAINDTTSWTNYSEIKFSNLSSTNWTTVTWNFTIPPNSSINFHIGYIPTGSSLTQAPGNLLIRNLRLYKTAQFPLYHHN